MTTAALLDWKSPSTALCSSRSPSPVRWSTRRATSLSSQLSPSTLALPRFENTRSRVRECDLRTRRDSRHSFPQVTSVANYDSSPKRLRATVFTQNDPLERGVGTPGNSGYAYAANNPAVYTDPSGLRESSGRECREKYFAKVDSGVPWIAKGFTRMAFGASESLCRKLPGAIVGGSKAGVMIAIELIPGKSCYDIYREGLTLGDGFGCLASAAAVGGAAYKIVKAGRMVKAIELVEASEATNTPGASRTVIGKVADLEAPGALGQGEATLLDRLPNQGSPKANWEQNSGVLREEMGRGAPIRDASVNPQTGELLNNNGFLRAERNLLSSRGWSYDPKTRLWSPPGR